MTVEYDSAAEVIDIADLEGLPPYLQISPKTSLHNTNSSSEAYDILSDAATNGARVTISVHDTESGVLFHEIFNNEGHSEGISASYFLDEVMQDRSLSDVILDELRSHSPDLVDPDLFQPDFYQIYVHDK